MSALQQTVSHGVLAVVAIVGVVVLAITGHVSGDAALTVVIAAAGIGGTGIAGSATGPAPSKP
jgi:hypothetical protein